jgi:hypothetical protein
MWGGKHHVEVHSDLWWIERMELAGFRYSDRLTTLFRAVANHFSLVDSAEGQHIVYTMHAFINPKVASLPEHAHLVGQYGCYNGNIDVDADEFDCDMTEDPDTAGENPPRSFLPVHRSPTHWDQFAIQHEYGGHIGTVMRGYWRNATVRYNLSKLNDVGQGAETRDPTHSRRRVMGAHSSDARSRTATAGSTRALARRSLPPPRPLLQRPPRHHSSWRSRPRRRLERQRAPPRGPRRPRQQRSSSGGACATSRACMPRTAARPRAGCASSARDARSAIDLTFNPLRGDKRVELVVVGDGSRLHGMRGTTVGGPVAKITARGRVRGLCASNWKG